MNKNKKIMILGAGYDQLPLIIKAKEMGLYTVVVSPGDYPGMRYADKVIDCDIRDEEGVCRAARQEEVDGITSDKTDMPLLAMARACEELGLAGNRYDSVKLFVDKYLMRERCSELGIPTIEYCRAESVEEGLDFLGSTGAPVIIKPVDSCASKGISRVDSPEEMRSSFPEAMSYSSTGEVIIERFIEGQELEVDSIVLGGRSKLLMHADLESFRSIDVFASTTRLYPSVQDEETIRKLLDLDKRILDAFELTQGLTHNEYILDRDGNINLLEVAARGGGTNISTNIARLQTGVDTPEFLINAALGTIDELPDFETGLCHSGYVAFYVPPGKVVSVEGIDEVEALPYVDKTTMDTIHLGMEADSFSDKRMRHAIVLWGDTRKQLEERIENVRGILKIKTETDSGLRGLIWE